MIRVKLFTAAAVIFGASAALAPGLVSAQELPVLSDAIVFSGNAVITGGGGNTCVNAVVHVPFGPTESVCLPQPPVVPGPTCGVAVCLLGGTGTFTFGTTEAVCFSDPTEVAISPACSITANGTFENLVCGTGAAHGAATISGEPEGAEAATFDIVFVATIGLVTGQINEVPAEPIVGVVQIGSTSPGNPAAGQCVTAFTVTGAIVALEPVGAP